VVDDDHQVRDLTCEVLAAAGFNILSAKNGFDALLGVASNDDEAIDLLVTEVDMPGDDRTRVGEANNSPPA